MARSPALVGRPGKLFPSVIAGWLALADLTTYAVGSQDIENPARYATTSTACLPECTASVPLPDVVSWSLVPTSTLPYVTATTGPYDITVTETITLIRNLTANTSYYVSSILCGIQTADRNAQGTATTVIEIQPGVTTTLAYPTQLTYFPTDQYEWGGVLATGSPNGTICSVQTSGSATVPFPSQPAQSDADLFPLFPSSYADLVGSCYVPVRFPAAVAPTWFAAAYPGEGALQTSNCQVYTTPSIANPSSTGPQSSSSPGPTSGLRATISTADPTLDVGAATSSAPVLNAPLFSNSSTTASTTISEASTSTTTTTSSSTSTSEVSVSITITTSSSTSTPAASTSASSTSESSATSASSTVQSSSQSLSATTSSALGGVVTLPSALVLSLTVTSVIGGQTTSATSVPTPQAESLSTTLEVTSSTGQISSSLGTTAIIVPLTISSIEETTASGTTTLSNAAASSSNSAAVSSSGTGSTVLIGPITATVTATASTGIIATLSTVIPIPPSVTTLTTPAPNNTSNATLSSGSPSSTVTVEQSNGASAVVSSSMAVVLALLGLLL